MTANPSVNWGIDLATGSKCLAELIKKLQELNVVLEDQRKIFTKTNPSVNVQSELESFAGF